MGVITQAWQRAEDEASGDGGDCPSPIAVHPVAERAEFDGGEEAAEKGPRGGGPGAEHPVNQRREQADRQCDSGPRNSENHLADGDSDALAEGVDGTISRLLEDVI